MTPEIVKGGAVLEELIEGPFGDDPTLVEYIYIIETGQQVEAMDR
jgi:hypothetical protein